MFDLELLFPCAIRQNVVQQFKSRFANKCPDQTDCTCGWSG